ncbi:MAG: 4Fe-4S dicluster domain-containing protein [Deltaproteobacteria bacterium]|nr:4Fe-4S dicluster domain-containing protein [Deltaproteobacteria bacterium]
MEEKREPVDLARSDFNFANQVAQTEGGQQISRCFACGTCSASCPVRRINDKYNPRRIIRQVLLGLKEEVLKSGFVWLCSACYSCQERCPQGVKITDIMTALKNMAASSNCVPDGVLAQMELIKKQGKVYAIDEFDNKKRIKAGLPPLPEEIDEIAQLLSVP